MSGNPSPAQIKKILQSAKRIAVVGLSDNPERESYLVSKEMQQRGYKIIPINPNVDEVLGEQAFPSLHNLPVEVDIVNVFRRSDALPEVVREAVQLSAPIIWAQQGVSHPEAVEVAETNGKTLIMDLCIAVAHSIYVGKA